MWKEFKEFAMKGNVIDLAVGVIIGGAFGAIVNSLVNDVIMPFVGVLTGGIDFSNWFIALDGKHYESLAKAKENAPTLAYGSFISAVVNFLIIAFSIFIVIRQLNKFRKKTPAPQPVTTKACPFCKSSIHIDAVRCPSCTSVLEEEK